jgi:hypothetical protein
MSTFVIEGIEAKRALTTNHISAFLDIILRGHRAQIALKAFRLFRLPVSYPLNVPITKSTSDTITTIKSRMFHPFQIYA